MGSPAMTSLKDTLAGVARLGLDTAPVIYFVEANPVYDARVDAGWSWLNGNFCNQRVQAFPFFPGTGTSHPTHRLPRYSLSQTLLPRMEFSISGISSGRVMPGRA